MFHRPRPSIPALGALLAALPCVAATALAGNWTAPTPAELAMQKCSFDPGADAEALLWEVTVDDSPSGHSQDTVLDHYLRVKIFTDAGADKYSTISIRHSRSSGISLVSARTVAPDGTVSNLRGDAVFKTTELKTSDEELRKTTFAIPNVTAGSIVEYRYRETRHDWLAHYVLLPLQLDVPAAVVRYHIRPVPSTTYEMRYVGLNTGVPQFQPGVGGFYTTSVHVKPAFVEEPYMPPRDQVQAAILVYYSAGQPDSPAKFWHDAGRRDADWFDGMCRANRNMKDVAATVAETNGAPAERLQRLFDWCRRNVDNRTNAAREGRPVDDENVRPNRSAADVLAHGAGGDTDVNLLFGALARAAGFDVRLAMAASRTRRFFDPSLMVEVGLDRPLIAVRLDGAWKLFDPGSPTAPFAGLRWPQEGTAALLCDRDSARIIDTPIRPPAYSLTMRQAHFRLDADGTLEGDVHMVLTGHANDTRRRREADESLQQREQDITDRVHERLPTAEVSDVQVETDLPDTTLRYEETLHVRVPDYATRVGRRLLVQPGVFTHGGTPPFTAHTRRYPICFAYPWAEVDSVWIELPPGFVVDAADQPKPVEVPGVGVYVASARLSPDAREIVYVRQLRFGDGGTICFPRDSYEALRGAFDMFHERDEFTLTLHEPGGE